LIGAIIFSIVKPIWALYFILIFDVYWLFRVVYFVFYLMISWRRLKVDSRVDWLDKLKREKPDWTRIWHLIFLPTSKEDIEILRATLASLSKSRYEAKRFIIVLSGEERGGGERFLRDAEILQTEFQNSFGHFLTILHPENLPDEIPGKGSNLNFAGHRVREFIDGLKIPYPDIIVSAFDIDTITHPQYFAYLSYKYLTVPDPLHSSYQPIALYNNNIWEAPALIQIASLGTTFWLMTELPRPERLFTFSSHSMPWTALTEVGFWQKDIVTEDSRIFLQCFLHYNGDYRVTPLYLPVSMDTVTGANYLQSLVALYKQQRRWAWGIEHFPYMVWHFFQRRAIPLRKKIKFIWNLGEGMYSWATAPILIFILGRLPFIAGDSFLGVSVFFQLTPLMLQWLMRAAMVGILVSAILTSKLLPPLPSTTSSYRRLLVILQWLLLPLTLIIFGSIPAFDAQTRLMLGKYLGFNVTEKYRQKLSSRTLDVVAKI